MPNDPNLDDTPQSSREGRAHPVPTGATAATATGRGTRREIVAWAMYDWANSAYSTLLITVLYFYISTLFPSPEHKDAAFPVVYLGETVVQGPVVYAWGIGLSMLVAAILSPIVGALADARANKRLWFRSTALAGALLGTTIGLISPHSPWLVLGCFVLASFCFELSFGFYNSFLPEIADEITMNRVSSWGFAAGYIGGGVVLAMALGLMTAGDRLGLDSLSARMRASLVLMGCWWALFSMPAIWILRDRGRPRSSAVGFRAAAHQAVGEVATTLGHIRQFQSLAWFLIGFLFYNDAVQTVLTQSSAFAEKEIGLNVRQLIPVILMIQFVSMPGALAVGWLADKIGQKQALYLCLAVWVALLSFSWWVTTENEFWIMGAVVALVMGGIQSVSRSIMGVMTPANRTAEFFGFYNLSSKATSFIGPFTFGLVIHLTGSARLAILSLLAQLIIGWLLVSRVNIARGRADAIRASEATTQ
ncbi:MAG: MFS transporter [Pirellulales bacterium]